MLPDIGIWHLIRKEQKFIDMIRIKETKLSHGEYSIAIGNKRKIWQIPTLIQHCKEQNYKTFRLPINAIDISVNVWEVDSILEFSDHAKRIKLVNKHYPILLDNTGFICDGWHRVVYAIINDIEYIDAIRIEEMPEPCRIEEI